MLNDKIIPKIEEIDLTKIDWNVLDIKQFHDIEMKLLANNITIKKAIKKAKLKEKKLTGNNGNIVIRLRDKNYSVKDSVYQRLKDLKSEKSKEKLIEEIISTYNPIQDL